MATTKKKATAKPAATPKSPATKKSTPKRKPATKPSTKPPTKPPAPITPTPPITPPTPPISGGSRGFLGWIIGGIALLLLLILGFFAAISLRQNDNRIENKFDGKVDTLSTGLNAAFNYIDQVAYNDSLMIVTGDAKLRSKIDSLTEALKKKNSGSFRLPKHNHPEYVDSTFVNNKVSRTTTITNNTASTVTKTAPCDCKKKKRKRRSAPINTYTGGGEFGY